MFAQSDFAKAKKAKKANGYARSLYLSETSLPRIHLDLRPPGLSYVL
jgi:hypothetical protein